jgi:fibronectin type 3 domain-containing protein
VKRSTSNGGPYTNIAFTTQTNYVDLGLTNGTTYYYVVTATNGAGASANSTQVSATPLAGPPGNSTMLIDVDINSGANTQTGAAVLGAAGDVWNGVTGNTSNLKNSTNTTLTGVGFFLSGNSGLNDNTGGVATMDTATTPLMRDCAYGANTTFTTGINGLGAHIGDAFTLVVYAAIGDPNQGSSLTLSGATGGNSATRQTTTGFSRSLTNVPPNGGVGVAYQVFIGTISSSTLTITDNNNGKTPYGGVNGFQLQLVSQPPTITTPPVSHTPLAGSTVTFSVGASGTSPLSYRWQVNGGTGFTNLVDGGQISGAASNVLTITNVTANWALAYQVIVTNSFGSVTSSPAVTLTLATNVIINGDFGSAATQTGAAVQGASGDVWNAITGTTSTMINSTGDSLSGVGLTLSTQGVYTDAAGTAMDAATTPLMQDYAFANTAPPTVTVSLTGLNAFTNKAFTLTVYAAGDNSGQGATLSLTGATGGNSASVLTTSATSRQISAGLGVAYQTFTGIITNGTLTFTAATNSGQSFTVVNGFQLQVSLLTGVQTPITIANGSFESQSVSACTYTSFGAGAPTAWSASGIANAVVALVDPCTTDGRGFSTIPPPGMEGTNYCQIFVYTGSGGGTVYLDTGVKYLAGTTYQLTTAFGKENGTFAAGSTMCLFNSSLTVVTSTVINSASITLGTFKDFSVTYTGTGSEGGNGNVIVGFKVPTVASTAFFDFDNVRLVATSPVASPTGLVATAGTNQVSLSWTATSGATSYNVKRAPVNGGPYTTIASPTVTSYLDTNVVAGTTYYYVVSAANAVGEGFNSAQVSATPVGFLPSPWQTQDIGVVGLAGSGNYSNGIFTITGAGTNIAGAADSFRFVYQASSADCSNTVRVATLQNTSSNANCKAGVMIRESLNANATEAGVWVTPSNGIISTYRTSTGGATSTNASAGKTAPYWVRIARTGNSFMAYYSSNGTAWTQLGSASNITMSSSAYIGMGLDSGVTNTLNKVTMDNTTTVP